MKKALSIFTPSFEEDLLTTLNRGLSVFSSPNVDFLPSVDIVQKGDAYFLTMELPGFDEKNIEIELQNRNLSISSKMEENSEKEETEGDVHFLVKERRTKNFSRSFTLPEDSDLENITADFSKGLLNIKVLKKAESKAKRISISSN